MLKSLPKSSLLTEVLCRALGAENKSSQTENNDFPISFDPTPAVCNMSLVNTLLFPLTN